MSATTRAQSATALRALAKRVEQGHAIEATPGHLRDAARAVERGNHEGARRHLIAAMHTFEPRMLYRHGIMNDSGHARARADLGQVHRQYLRVRDLQDEEARADDRRQAAAARRAASDGGNTAAGRPPPPSPDGDGPQLSAGLGFAEPTTEEQMRIAYIGLAMTDDEVALLNRDDILLSAETEALASTHRPFGKPGGPGLWNVKGMQLPAYIQNIARALLRTGRARNLSHAIAIARAATKRWAKGGGHVHPEVRAASAATGAEWEASRARAHAHSNPMDLAFNPAEPRGPGGKWRAVASALGLHGKQVFGRTAQGNVVKGTYDHSARQVVTRIGGRSTVTHVAPVSDADVDIAAMGIGRQNFAGEPGREILLFNPYHAPPGTGGGQFTTAGGAGKGSAPGAKAAVAGTQRAVLVAQVKVLRAQISALQRSLVTGNAPPAGTMPSRTARAGKAGTAAAARKATAPGKAQAAKSKSSTPRKHGVTKMSARTRAQVKARIVQLQAQLRSDLAKLHGH